jgi:hypothetical protein
MAWSTVGPTEPVSRRTGGAKARCAVARRILIIVWYLLNDPSAHAAQLLVAGGLALVPHLRQFQALGLEVAITPPPKT